MNGDTLRWMSNLRPSRREWMQSAALGAVAAALKTRRLPAAAPSVAGTAQVGRPIRSCILVFHYGGPSQLESFDPKPQAPAEVRGEYGVIGTSAPGIQISEHWPLTAQVMHHLTLIRSVHHPMRNHNAAAAEMLTGRTPAGGDLELLADEARSYPTLGSAVSYALGERAHVLPYVALPYTMYNVVQLPGQTPGFLGGVYDRFQVEGNPNSEQFSVSALEARRPGGAAEVAHRRQLLDQLDRELGHKAESRMATYQQRALELISSDSVQHAFDIDRESPEDRDRYGRTLLGQSTLLARRLVESGVNFVSVFDGQRNGQLANWDSHTDLFPRHKELIPPADRAVSALIADLAERGLLESTLVVTLAEFGRTPKINGNAGRDHWPDCYTVTMAGGGVRGGNVYGASDAIAAYPELDPVTPADIAATIFSRFGIDPRLEVNDQTDRPFRLADGEPIAGILA